MANQQSQSYEPPIPGWALAIILYAILFVICACYWYYKRRQMTEEEKLEAKAAKDGYEQDENEHESESEIRKSDRHKKTDGPEKRRINTRTNVAEPPPEKRRIDTRTNVAEPPPEKRQIDTRTNVAEPPPEKRRIDTRTDVAESPPEKRRIDTRTNVAEPPPEKRRLDTRTDVAEPPLSDNRPDVQLARLINEALEDTDMTKDLDDRGCIGTRMDMAGPSPFADPKAKIKKRKFFQIFGR